MSNYPEDADVFVEKDGTDNISSSDPNNAFAAIETTQGLVGALGKPQSWSTTLMTLLQKYRAGFDVGVAGGAPIVDAGEITLTNTDGSKFVFRRNPTQTTLTTAMIDTGALAPTTYYIYAIGGSATTTAPFQYSIDQYAPGSIGTAPYRQVGWFRNEIGAALAVTYAGSHEGTGGSDGTKFADWIPLAADTASHLAYGDGFVLARSGVGTSADIRGYTDSADPPTTLMAGNSHYEGTQSTVSSFSMPVRKGDYWKVTGVEAGSVYFISN